MSPKTRFALAALVIASLVPGAALLAQDSPNNPLAGTEWRLVDFQSMDDTIGTVRPDDPSLYTMRLGEDGAVSMRLNCNRANGTWTAEPGTGGDSGGFEFENLTATQALCPQPSMDERIVRDAEYVRSYLLRDGRLHLSLMADAGIYAWEPLPGVPFEMVADEELEDAIRGASPDYTRRMVEISDRRARYLYARVDLNGDGEKEVFAYLLGSIFCGSGGCDLFLFGSGDEGSGEDRLALVQKFPLSRLPVIVAPETTNGWSDLFRLESGGGAEPSYVRHTFDGEGYVEAGRLPAEPAPEGTPLMVGEFMFDDGIPLEPASAERMIGR